MTWRQIKKRLKAGGLHQVDLAKRWHSSESTVSKFLYGAFDSDRLRGLLAGELGVDVTEIPKTSRCPTCHQPYRKTG